MQVFWYYPEKCVSFSVSPPLGTIIIRLGGLLSQNESPKSYSKGLREAFLCRLQVYRTAISQNTLLWLQSDYKKRQELVKRYDAVNCKFRHKFHKNTTNQLITGLPSFILPKILWHKRAVLQSYFPEKLKEYSSRFSISIFHFTGLLIQFQDLAAQIIG